MKKTLVYTMVIAMPADDVEGLEEILETAQGYGAARILDVALVNREFDAVPEEDALAAARESLAQL